MLIDVDANLSKYNKRKNQIEYYKFSYNKCKLLGKNKYTSKCKTFQERNLNFLIRYVECF